MTFPSGTPSLQPKERADYGFAIVRDAAFDAVRALWSRRQKEGMSQLQLAEAIGRDPGWVSRNLRSPGNWTLRTFGELVQGLGGEPSIGVSAIEDLECESFSDAYEGYVNAPALVILGNSTRR